MWVQFLCIALLSSCHRCDSLKLYDCWNKQELANIFNPASYRHHLRLYNAHSWADYAPSARKDKGHQPKTHSAKTSPRVDFWKFLFMLAAHIHGCFAPSTMSAQRDANLKQSLNTLISVQSLQPCCMRLMRSSRRIQPPVKMTLKLPAY